MPIFAAMAANLQDKPNDMSAAAAQALVKQVVEIANLSPTLAREITNFQDAHGTLIIGNPTEEHTGDFGEGSPPTIELPTIGDFQPGTTGLTFSSSSQPESAVISQAGQLVGTLAHELGHYMDAGLPEADKLSYTVDINQGLKTGLNLLSEGKATANAVKVAQEAADAPGSTAADRTMVPLGGSTAKELTLLQQNLDPLTPAALGNFASAFSNVITSAPGNPDYMRYYLDGFGAGVKDPSLYVDGSGTSSVTQEKIVAAADGSLQDLDLFRTGVNGSPSETVYNLPESTRFDYGAAKQLIDSDKESAAGASELTTYYASAANYSSLDWSGSNGTGTITGVAMAGADVTAKLDPSLLQGAISGFAPGDTIDLAGVGGVTAVSLQNDTLAVQESGQTIALKLDPAQSYAGDLLSFASDGNGGVDIAAEASPTQSMVSAVDTTKSPPASATAAPPTAPASGPSAEYADITPASLNIPASAPSQFVSQFVQGSGGNDAGAASVPGSGVNSALATALNIDSAAAGLFPGGYGTDAGNWSMTDDVSANGAGMVGGSGPSHLGVAWQAAQGVGHAGLTSHPMAATAA